MSKKKYYLRYILIYLILLVALFLFLTPILWIGLSSLKESGDIFSVPPTFIPNPPTIQQYTDAITNRPIGRTFFNSIFIASVTTVFSLIIGFFGAYAFARTNTKTSGILLMFIMLGRMLPSIAIVVPLYIIMRKVQLLDTFQGLIIAHITFTLPFSIFMLRGFISQLPRELEEASYIDGCSKVGALIRITLPLTAPGLGATAIFNFLLSWNEFLYAVILTMSDKVRTFPVTLVGFDTGRDVYWGQMFAAIVIALVPAVLFAIFAQKYLVRGITIGAVKG